MSRQLLAAVAVLLLPLGCAQKPLQGSVRHSVTRTCQEDDPCWNCHEINHRCGPLGPRLQRKAGDRYEVIYYPASGVYAAEPKR